MGGSGKNSAPPALGDPAIEHPLPNTQTPTTPSFSPSQAAGIVRKEAQGLGIAIDHRRKNRSEEAFQLNVQRLKTYKSKLVVFPRNIRRPKKGDSPAAELNGVSQVTSKQTLPIAAPLSRADIKPRKITSEESEFRAYATVRKIRTDTKLWGARERRAALKAAEEASSAKK